MDEAVSEYVQMIFSMYKDGFSIGRIDVYKRQVQISFRVRHLRLNFKDVCADCLCQRLGNLRGHAGRRELKKLLQKTILQLL